MFDFAWSEIGLIAAVALILIGPKDMPVAIRTVTDMIKKARRMASEFQTHVDEMMREADLGDVRQQINSIRNFDFRGEIERHIDPDHALRDTFSANPLEPTPTSETSAATSGEAAAVAELEPIALADPASPERAGEAEPTPDAPAFVPPEFVTLAATRSVEAEAPAFIPPQVVLQRGTRPAA